MCVCVSGCLCCRDTSAWSCRCIAWCVSPLSAWPCPSPSVCSLSSPRLHTDHCANTHTHTRRHTHTRTHTHTPHTHTPWPQLCTPAPALSSLTDIKGVRDSRGERRMRKMVKREREMGKERERK